MKVNSSKLATKLFCFSWKCLEGKYLKIVSVAGQALNSGPGTPAPEPLGRRVSRAPQADRFALPLPLSPGSTPWFFQLGSGLRRAMPLPDTMFCAQQIHIPPELPDILKQFTKAAIRTQPADVLQWSAG